MDNFYSDNQKEKDKKLFGELGFVICGMIFCGLIALTFFIK